MIAIINIINLNFLKHIYSSWVNVLLRLRGVKVGRNFTARELPILVKDKRSNITIGDNVVFKDQVDLRALKGAEIIIENGVRFDKDVRIVATNGAKVKFSENADIGCYTIFNCGADVHIGRDVLVAGFCYVQTSNHKIARNQIIQTQGYTHKAIHIGDDCWLGGGSFILPGATLGTGVVVGANSLVNKKVPDFQVVTGSPARLSFKRK